MIVDSMSLEAFHRGLSDFNRLIYFTKEEVYMTAKLIEGIDNNNVLKRDLQRKLACVYDSTSIAADIKSLKKYVQKL